MRISIYCHSIAPSIDGVCRRFTGILEELCKQGHEIQLFTLEEVPEELPAAIKRENIITLPYFFMPAYPDKKVAKPTFVAMYHIYSNLRRFRPEVIHVTADGIAQMFALGGLLVQVPVVGSFHTDILDLVKSRNANWFQKGVILFKEFVDCRVMNSCATTSKSFSRKLAVQGAKIDHIIQTAVNSEVFHPSKINKDLRSELTFGHPDAFLCVYVGRISKEKKLDVIVDALKDIDDAYLAIIGDGPEGATFAARHSKHHRIYCKPRFLNHHELAEVYASSDIHVSASEFETLGNTVLEAFSCSIPVVVPRTQGFCDTVDHEVDGFLFNPADSQDAARYILQLRNDKKLRQKMGSAGQKTCENRTIEVVVADMLNWYRQGWAHWKRRMFVVTFSLTMLMLPSILFAIISIQSYLYLTDFMVHVLGIKIVEDSPVVEATDSEASSSPKVGSANGDAEGEKRNARAALTKSPARRTPSRGKRRTDSADDAGATADSTDGDALDATDSPLDGATTPSTRSQTRRRRSSGVSK